MKTRLVKTKAVRHVPISLSFFNSVFSGVTGQAVEGILEIARGVVKEIDQDPSILSSADKRQAAFDRIKTTALAEGKEIASHAINLAIELAVAELRN